MARPERFATLEHKASPSDSRTTVARNSRAFPESILDDLIAPPDQRAYRVIYLASRPEAIYVLHCFQKKTEKTSQRDIELAKTRFKAVPKALRNEQ